MCLPEKLLLNYAVSIFVVQGVRKLLFSLLKINAKFKKFQKLCIVNDTAVRLHKSHSYKQNMINIKKHVNKM